MFFIAGAGKEAITIAEGKFCCPQCDRLRKYVQRRITSYVSAFLVPVWRSSGGSEFVECQSCGGQFDNGVLTADFDRTREAQRLLEAAVESGRIAMESREPEIAQSRYGVAVEAFRLALQISTDADQKRAAVDALSTLEKWFPSTLCINEALGICDEVNRPGHSIKEALEMLRQAQRILEQGLAKHDAGYDGIMSIYEQVIHYVQQAEAMLEAKDQ